MLRRILYSLTLAATVISSLSAQAVQVNEYELKTAYLYNFALFVTWPVTLLEDNDNTIGICTIGKDQFGNSIDQLHNRKLREKRLVVRRSVDLKQAASCHMLYIAESERPNIPAIMESLRGASVLTIIDAPVRPAMNHGIDPITIASGPASPSIITLFFEDNKLMFEVNSAAAKQAGLTISSRLLYLARQVH